MSVCRVHVPTTDEDARMFKYAVRHWAHYRCWLWSRIADLPKPITAQGITDLLSELHVHELNAFPIMALAEELESYGIYGRAIIVMKAAIRIAKRRESTHR